LLFDLLGNTLGSKPNTQASLRTTTHPPNAVTPLFLSFDLLGLQIFHQDMFASLILTT